MKQKVVQPSIERLFTTAILASALLVAVLGTVAGAEQSFDTLPRSFAEVSMLVIVQPDGTVDNHYLIGPLGGTSAGISAAIAHTFPNHLFTEGGARFRGGVSRDQIAPIGGLTSFTTNHREMAGDFLIGFETKPHSLLRIAPAMGVTIIRGVTTHEHITARPFGSDRSISIPDTEVVNTWFGLAYGVRALIEVNPRLGVTASLRGNWVRGRDMTPSTTFGLGTALFDIGFGIAVSF